MPGVDATARNARLVGIGVVGIVAVLFAAWHLVPRGDDPNDVSVILLTEQVGEGVGSGSDVRFDGVKVGAVASIESAGSRRQQVELALDKSQLFDLTDALSIDYAPGNLFGISEIELNAGPGGRSLQDRSVVDLTGPAADRARDATMSTLLRSVGQLTTDVFSPQMVSVMNTVANDTKAFTPLFQTIVTTVESIADTQKLPPSFLFDQVGSSLAGVPPTLDGALHLLLTAYENEYMKSDTNRAKFDASFAMLQNQLLPAAARTLGSAHANLAGYVDLLTPILRMLAGTVPTPERSGRELGILLDRIDKTLRPTDNGPVLAVDVDLSGVPGLAAPLRAAVSAPGQAGTR